MEDFTVEKPEGRNPVLEDSGMGKFRWIAGILLISAVLCGCGETEEGKSKTAEAAGAEVEILKDGSILETMTETFDKSYYDETNLRDMLLAEVADFNEGLEEGNVTVDKFENTDGKLTVSVKYPSADVYSAYNTDPYNNKALFSGTIAQAHEAGHSFDISMTDVNGEKTIGKDDILGMGSSMVLISESPMRVKVAGKILYVGENVEALGKGRAEMKAGENGESLGKYYIIYK
jgi:hypothetical protein